jgi:hypothetical protein
MPAPAAPAVGVDIVGEGRQPTLDHARGAVRMGAARREVARDLGDDGDAAGVVRQWHEYTCTESYPLFVKVIRVGR